jgi:hypothetical protein
VQSFIKTFLIMTKLTWIVIACWITNYCKAESSDSLVQITKSTFDAGIPKQNVGFANAKKLNNGLTVVRVLL